MSDRFKPVLAGLAALAVTAASAVTASGIAEAVTAPYCAFDHFAPKWVGVTGPAGERITVNGHRKHKLVRYDVDTEDEADGFTGLYYVEMVRRHHVGSIVVRVNGHRCVTT